MSTAYRVDVGTPPEKFEGWTTINLCFHGFANLTTTKDQSVVSPEFSCFCHQWVLRIYPGGEEDSPEGCVAVELSNRSNNSIKIEYGFSVRDANGKEVVCCKPETQEFDAYVDDGDNARCIPAFAQRSTVMDLLVQGSLVIEVRMKLPSTGNNVTQFIPTNPINKNVLDSFNEEETADVVFEIGGEQSTGTTTRKKSKTTTNFHAHSIILKNNTSALYEICGKSDERVEELPSCQLQICQA